jgi:hypothetical protein
MSEESYEYEHKTYPAGLNVFIDLAIREIHPLSRVAGLVGVTCKGIAYRNLEMFEDQTAKVPVDFPGVGIFYVEEEYVKRQGI